MAALRAATTPASYIPEVMLTLDGQCLDLALVRIENPDPSVGNGAGAVPDVSIPADVDLWHVTSPRCRIVGELLRLWIEADQGTPHSSIADPDGIGVALHPDAVGLSESGSHVELHLLTCF